jgi:serine/threonine-protein kinase RsbW
MIQTIPSADVADGERFERIGLHADAGAAAHTRHEFAEWLSEFFDLDPIRTSDLVLAINEALANAAEYAYVLANGPGTMDMYAEHDPASEKLRVRICDHGLWWRRPVASPTSRTRGRGIPLMRALSDDVAIEASPEGTQVCLEWNGVGRRR